MILHKPEEISRHMDKMIHYVRNSLPYHAIVKEHAWQFYRPKNFLVLVITEPMSDSRKIMRHFDKPRIASIRRKIRIPPTTYGCMRRGEPLNITLLNTQAILYFGWGVKTAPDKFDKSVLVDYLM